MRDAASRNRVACESCSACYPSIYLAIYLSIYLPLPLPLPLTRSARLLVVVKDDANGLLDARVLAARLDRVAPVRLEGEREREINSPNHRDG